MSRSPSQQLAEWFDPEVRGRGEDYYERRRVQIALATPVQVVATVQGTSLYRVALERRGAEVLTSCTCPYHEVDACKHLWAVILAAGSREFLKGSDGALKLVRAPRPPGVEPARPAPVPGQGLPSRLPQSLPSPANAPPAGARRGPGSSMPAWRRQLARLPGGDPVDELLAGEGWFLSRQLIYVVAPGWDVNELLVEVFSRDRKMDGGWSKPKPLRLARELLDQLPEESDRKILGLLGGGGGYDYDPDELPSGYQLNVSQGRWLLPEICQSGRCCLRRNEEDEEPRWLPVRWDAGGPWMLQLTVAAGHDGHYELSGALLRDGDAIDLSLVELCSPSVLFTKSGGALRYEPAGAATWIAWLTKHGPLTVPVAHREEFLNELLRQPGLPPLTVPPELTYEEVAVPPVPRLIVRPGGTAEAPLRGELSFDYAGLSAALDDTSRVLVHAGERRVVRRDAAAERAAAARLAPLGWRWTHSHRAESQLELAARHLPRVVRELAAAGWVVEADGRLYRAAGRIDIQVSSGIDWFELHGEVGFGDSHVSLPALLSALREGKDMVRLDDGSYGVLPESWLKQYGLLAGLGTRHEEHLRFKLTQATLLDALLADHPQSRCDEVFQRARDELAHFKGIESAAPPAGFTGELRPYQQDGLGWLMFLQRFGFGGCLADDMGLGKTVQVLALLEARRELRAGSGRLRADGRPMGPSLVIMPKSLIFNWKQEAQRFAPRLKVLDHTGAGRQKGTEHVDDYDVILTTYGTLRNDVIEFKDVCFDYVILDEAQAIKNASSASAKAVRLLTADHRLAMSGTPIENHLGELWSLFEFLNPGMLGTAAVFQAARGGERGADPEVRRVLAQALRPFMLRRTKEQVVRDLPPKVEQTLYCDLEKEQRRDYDRLREYYRVHLLQRIETEGLARAKIQVLEALLRLRQAAIHPGLLDDRRRTDSSAKLDVLLPLLTQVNEEGHKALVFSQFTGMLSILRGHLDEEGIPYEYLDGRTADRQACVKRFQEDPDCRLFLISLKAGGVGLNLTAAQYVFLLDPWWNPAVETQAIDRAHRIGQQAKVFAYRLIARDTVEEKVMELQRTKRQLADAILGEDNSLIGELGVEDLQLLLS